MKKKTIYLAAGLFNAGERMHVLYLEKYLLELGYDVIQPLREAKKFFKGDGFDVAGIVGGCEKHVRNPDNICACSTDGADADSGTAVEYGLAIAATGRAVVYRTDFRTNAEKELGVNTMLKSRGSVFVYHPCFITELDEIEGYYRELARKIDEGIEKALAGDNKPLAGKTVESA